MATQNDELEDDPITGLKRPKTPPTATDFGAAYQKSVMDRLQGHDAVVDDQRQKNQASDAVQQYLAGERARTTSARAGYDPGTLQYQRTQDREEATANASARDSRVALGDLARARGSEVMGMAQGLEQQEQKAQEDLINSLTDNAVAQNYLRRVQAAGGDVRAAYESMFGGAGGAGGSGTGSGGSGTGTDAGAAGAGGTTTGNAGTLSDAFRPQTDEQKKLEAIKDRLRTGGFTGDVDAEALRLYNQQNTDETAAADKTRRENLLSDAQRVVAAQGFDALTPEQKTAFLENVPMRDLSALPSNRSAVEDIVNGPAKDQFFKLGNTPYQILDYYQQTRWKRGGAFDDRHSDWTKVKDLNTGATKYIRSDGLVLDYRPPNPPDGGKIVYDTDTGVWRAGSKYYNPASEKWEKTPPSMAS